MKDPYLFRTLGLLLLLVAVTVVGVLLWQHGLYFCTVFMVLCAVGVMVWIFRLQLQLTRMCIRMIGAIRYSDLTLSFSPRKKKGIAQDLTVRLNEALHNIRGKMAEKESRFQLYETLLDSIDSMLIITTDRGAVEWMNTAAVRDLNGYQLRHVDELYSLNPEFPALLKEVLPGQIKTISIQKEAFQRVFIVTVTRYLSKGRELRLLNLRNIYSLLDQQEFESWQKLIRVLTHEMMNSIAPIISLSETLCDREAEGGHEDPIRTRALQTIHRRSKGLLEFVESYRKLTRLSAPVLCSVLVDDLFTGLQCLFQDPRIRYTFHVAEPLPLLMADRTQLEQVLINLLKNAAEACREKPSPEIWVSASFDSVNFLLNITVSDNGSGIPAEVADKIFIPFYTTKTGGSGIGLSLCKQIMTLHGGGITVKSNENEGSSFSLWFIVPGFSRAD